MMNIKITEKRPIRPDARRKVMECHSSRYERTGILSPKHVRYRGVALIWAAILMMLMILLIGLSLDQAKVALVTHQLHNAADAAALAGGPYVKRHPDDARQKAKMVGGLNSADGEPVFLDLNTDNSPDGDIIIGRYGYDPDANPPTWFFEPANPDTEYVNALAVIASRDADHVAPVSLNFGSIADVPSVNLTGWWQGKKGPYAIVITSGGTGAGLICFRPDGIGMELQGNTELTVNNIDTEADPADGAIQIDSSYDVGLSVGGSTVTVNAYAVNMWGHDHSSNPPGWEFGDTVKYVNYGSPPIGDPLAGLTPPPAEYWTPVSIPGVVTPGKVTQINQSDDITLPPGYYSGGWRMTGGKLTLQSGIYILDASAKGNDAGLFINGGILDASALTTATVPGDASTGGVMFYITGNAELYIGGGATVYADPMTAEDGDYNHMMFWQDKNNIQPATVIGNADSLINGTLYFPQPVDEVLPQGQQQFALNIQGEGTSFGNQIIAYSMSIDGTGEIIINYDGRNPAPENKAFLVE